VDLLGDVSEEGGNEKAACRASVLGTEGRNAAAVLLAGVSAPLKQNREFQSSFIQETTPQHAGAGSPAKAKTAMVNRGAG